MERVIASKIVATVEATAEVLTGSSRAKELRPVTGINSVKSRSVTKGESQFTATCEYIGKDGILKHILVAV